VRWLFGQTDIASGRDKDDPQPLPLVPVGHTSLIEGNWIGQLARHDSRFGETGVKTMRIRRPIFSAVRSESRRAPSPHQDFFAVTATLSHTILLGKLSSIPGTADHIPVLADVLCR
jgi:hypothetical protein